MKSLLHPDTALPRLLVCNWNCFWLRSVTRFFWGFSIHVAIDIVSSILTASLKTGWFYEIVGIIERKQRAEIYPVCQKARPVERQAFNGSYGRD
jgi:hypothetical protein